jgi:hypothetical protein
MPLEICKNARASRSTICKESNFSSPNKGYCASQKTYYYGYKLHGICSFSGVFQRLDITPASVHDITILSDDQSTIAPPALIDPCGERGAIQKLNWGEFYSEC